VNSSACALRRDDWHNYVKMTSDDDAGTKTRDASQLAKTWEAPVRKEGRLQYITAVLVT